MSNLVVFDFDGTLLNTFDLFKEVAEKYAKTNNLGLTDFEVIKRHYHQPEICDFGWGVERHIQVSHYNQICRVINNDLLHENIVPKLFPGVLDVLKTFKSSGISIGIITSRDSTSLSKILSFYAMNDFFDEIYSADTFMLMKPKPAPDMLLHMMQALGFPKNRTTMVGDTVMDIDMAHSAGVRSFGVSWGMHNEEDLKRSGASFVLKDNLFELVDFFSRGHFKCNMPSG